MSLTKALRVDTVGFPQRVSLDDIAMTREDGTQVCRATSSQNKYEQMGSEKWWMYHPNILFLYGYGSIPIEYIFSG